MALRRVKFGFRLEAYRSFSIFSPEYAFDMASSNIRFGRGVTREVGQDLVGFGLTKKVCVVTDQNLRNLPPFKEVLESLVKSNIQFEVFDEVSCEPSDKSFAIAIEFARRRNFDAFVAVGGGSVIDTAKASNLYMCFPDHDFLDFVNAPVGKGLPVPGKLKPLIAIPTTAGTGSEITGVSIFDHTGLGCKTGLRDKALRPSLGLIDPNHTVHCSPELTAYAGLDVLCHALESFTAVRYSNRRGGAPSSPHARPPYQGSNPISDIWSSFALTQCAKYLRRAVEGRPGSGGMEVDIEAREQMGLGSAAAAVGFGNAGVHLCHAMSYAISSNACSYLPPTGYDFAVQQKLNSRRSSSSPSPAASISTYPSSPTTHIDSLTDISIEKASLVPHGLSVALTAPSVFRWTAVADPERHLQAAALLGADTSNTSPSDAGLLLADTLTSLLHQWAFVPNGLREVGYSSDSETIDRLVNSTLHQKRLLEISPRIAYPEDLSFMLQDSMKLF